MKDLAIFHPPAGLKLTEDALHLAQWFCQHEADGDPGRVAIDLGCGNGVLAIIAAGRAGLQNVVALERDAALCAQARANAEANEVGKRVRVIRGDMRTPLLVPGRFRLALINPPYFAVGSGRRNPDPQVEAAYHETHCPLADWTASCARLLTDTGRVYGVYRSQRLPDLLGTLRHAGLEPKRLRFLHSRIDRPSKLVLFCATKGGGRELAVEPPGLLNSP